MKPLLTYLSLLLATAAAVVGGAVHPDGTEVDCDLPIDRHQRNMGGSDGAGLCVFTSIGMAADWCSETPLVDFRDWMRRRPGGGYPEKVTRMIRELCKERGIAEPRYLQLQGDDVELLAQAVRQSHLACVTYSRSPTGRYGGQRIAHMVNCVAARAGSSRHWAILDNNYPGSIEWMSEDEFRASYTGLGGGWAVILLKEGPPPVPRN
jgi:hypothetical protein